MINFQDHSSRQADAGCPLSAHPSRSAVPVSGTPSPMQRRCLGLRKPDRPGGDRAGAPIRRRLAERRERGPDRRDSSTSADYLRAGVRREFWCVRSRGGPSYSCPGVALVRPVELLRRTYRRTEAKGAPGGVVVLADAGREGRPRHRFFQRNSDRNVLTRPPEICERRISTDQLPLRGPPGSGLPCDC